RISRRIVRRNGNRRWRGGRDSECGGGAVDRSSLAIGRSATILPAGLVLLNVGDSVAVGRRTGDVIPSRTGIELPLIRGRRITAGKNRKGNIVTHRRGNIRRILGDRRRSRRR